MTQERNAMRYVCLLALIVLFLTTPLLFAQEGAAIYKEKCASCHDMPESRAPSLTAIKTMNGTNIYLALTSGAMKTQAQGMSTAQIFALLGYIAPTGGTPAAVTSLTRTCKTQAKFKPAPNAPEWNGWSSSVT